jgi:prophage regulatory protein
LSQPRVSHLIQLGDVIVRTGLSRSTILRYVERSIFPPPIKVGLKAIRWQAEEVEDYIARRASAAF